MQNTKIKRLHEEWAVARGYRTKVQAPSRKAQAPSCKLKTTSRKLQKFF
tara:strand:+ start:288 stop:434 length:147 start_codon:yes stop_codon:yes gene_type:complete